MAFQVQWTKFDLSPSLSPESKEAYSIYSLLCWSSDLTVEVNGKEWDRDDCIRMLNDSDKKKETAVPLIVKMGSNLNEKGVLEEDIAALKSYADSSNLISGWESRWIEALLAFANDDVYTFISTLDDHLAEFTDDVFTAYVQYFAIFSIGDSFGYKSNLSGLNVDGYYKAIWDAYLGFSKIELGEPEGVEELVSNALAFAPQNGWIIHAYIHYLDYYGKIEEGISLLRDMEPVLGKSVLKCHNTWHLAQFEVYVGDYSSAKMRYELEIACGYVCRFMIDDAASLLLAIELADFEVTSSDWEIIKNNVELFIDSHPQVFHDSHLWLACFKIGDPKQVSRCLDSVIKFAQNSLVYKKFGVKLCEALKLFVDKKFSAASDALFHLRGFIRQGYGGSLAQRHLYWKILCACLVSSDRELDKLRLKKVHHEVNLLFPHSKGFKKSLKNLKE